MTGMMGGYHDFISIYRGSTEFMAITSTVNLISDILMVIAAIMIRTHPQEQ